MHQPGVERRRVAASDEPIDVVWCDVCSVRVQDLMDFEAMVRRVRAEFLEMPGLRLTFAQAMRLWGLSENECQRVIDALIAACFLQKTSTGEVVRAT